jgi:hypothetical protein
MHNHSLPCGRATFETALGAFQGWPQSRHLVAISYPFGHPTPYAYGFCAIHALASSALAFHAFLLDALSFHAFVVLVEAFDAIATEAFATAATIIDVIVVAIVAFAEWGLEMLLMPNSFRIFRMKDSKVCKITVQASRN